MGSGIRGNYGNTEGSKKYSKIINSKSIYKRPYSPNNNLNLVTKNFIYNSESGKFGEKGKNSRIIKTNNVMKDSKYFFYKITKGIKKELLYNKKGFKAVFDDGSVIVYRPITSTKDSPAVNINITKIIDGGITTQKIHFVKGGK